MKNYLVEAIGQRTEHTCWEACGRMMWNWRWRADPAMKARYEDKAGVFLEVDRGFDTDQQAVFYKLLDLRVLKPAHGYNVRFALKWTPVIVALDSRPKGSTGHVVVVVSYTLSSYNVMDPRDVDFGQSGGYSASIHRFEKAELDERLVPQIFYW